jgi:Tol biopolymer transport system component
VTATFEEQALGGPLVYRSNADGAWNLYLSKLDGSGILKITDNHDTALEYQFPKWSHDGTKIAYVAYRAGSSRASEICIYDVETGKHEVINGYSVGGGRIAWLNDETLLVARRDYESGADLGDSSYLHFLAIDGSSYGSFYYASGIEIHSPDVSGDGLHVVTKVQPVVNGYRSEILLMDNQGNNAIRLTNTSTGSSNEVGNNRGCAFLDDEHILFTRGIAGGRRDLLIMDIDGSDVTSIGALFSGSLVIGYVPAVASDHLTIVLEASAQAGAAQDLYVTDRTGLAPVNITNTPGVIEDYPDVR